MHSVYCMENPLLDHVTKQDYAWLEGFGAKPGSMQLVQHRVFRSLMDASGPVQILPGGSGANTIRALAFLLGEDATTLGRPAYSGAIGRDEAGRSFASILGRMGIDLALAEKDSPTGVSAIVVTPDRERTMFTHLGACREFCPGDIAWDFLEDCRCFHSTGYMWDSPPEMEALKAAAQRAKSLGIPISFDLADPFVVDRYHADLGDWIRGRVSILFGNRDELSRMTGCEGTDEELGLAAAALAPLVLMKLGSRGCMVLENGKITAMLPAVPVKALDTTGAGDVFAAGFLYGFLKGMSLEASARQANRIAGGIVQVEGCNIDLLDRSEMLFVPEC